MAIDKLKTTSLEDNSITSDKIASGAVTISDIGDNEISMAKLSQVDLTIAPEVLEIQVDAPDMGQDTMWKWTWEQSTLPYARRTITNSNELNVPLYKEGTYVVNNFAAYDIHGSMTQTHSLYLKWVDGAGTDNLVSWATSAGPISDTHPDINGGNATDVQRITVNVPATITIPSLTNPSVSYTVVNNASGGYTFSGSAKGDNPNLGPFYRGGTYTVNINATGHPFYFTTDNGTNFSSGTYFGEYTSGVTGSRTDSGTITFTVPANAPDTLYYQCGNHSAMRGAITVKDLAVETNINGNYVVYFQHTQEGHRTPVELRPIPSLVNQMCLVYDNNTNKFVPQDLATYVENTPSFENKIREVAGTAELVVEDGSAVVAKVNVYDDSTYLPLTGNNPGDQAFATDTDILYIWDGSAWQQAGAANSDDLTEGSTNLFFTDARADARIAAATTTDLTEGTNLYYTDTRADARIAAATTTDLTEGTNLYYTDARADARAALLVDSAPGTLDTLNELAAALGDDPNFATTTANNIATKLPLAGGTLTGNLNFGTNDKAIFGAGSDLQIYHDGNDSKIIENGSGDLYIGGASNMRFVNSAVNATYAMFTEGGKVQLNYNDSKRFETTDLGIDVTGTVTSDGLTVDGAVSIGLDTAKTKFYSDSTYNGIYNGSGLTSEESIYMGGDTMFFYTDGSEAMRILSSGNVGIGTSSPSTKLELASNDSTNAGLTNLLTLTHTTTGTAGDGIGTRIVFNAEDDGGVESTMGYIDTLFTDVSDGAEKSAFAFSTRNGGSIAERMRIDSSGDVTLKSAGVVTLKAAPLGSNYGAGFNVMTVTGTSSSPYTSTIGFSNYSKTNAMVIQGDKVGIGETNPDYRLEVKGTATTNTDIVGFSNSNGTPKHIFGLENVGAGRYGIRDASNNTAVFFSAHDADDSYIDAGNVGIGTYTPSRNQHGSIDPRLHVYGSENSGFGLVARFQSGTDAENSGSAILVNHGNDRGLLIEAGRDGRDYPNPPYFNGTGNPASSSASISNDDAVAHLGILNSGGTNTRMMTLRQHSWIGDNKYNVGINQEYPVTKLEISDYKDGTGNNPNGIGLRLSSTAGSTGSNSANGGTGIEFAGHGHNYNGAGTGVAGSNPIAIRINPVYEYWGQNNSMSNYGQTYPYLKFDFKKSDNVNYITPLLVSGLGNGRVAIGNDTANVSHRLSLGSDAKPINYRVSGSGGHAIADGTYEENARSFSLGGGDSVSITEGTVSNANKWRVRFEGDFGNNYQGGGLNLPAAQIYVTNTQPTVYIGSTNITVSRDSGTGKLIATNQSGSYAVHFTGKITVWDHPQSNRPTFDSEMQAINLQGTDDYGTNLYGGLIMKTPVYSEYHFQWSGTQSHSLTFTCGSYQMSTMEYTSHQTNGGSDIHKYIFGKWANNHTTHTWNQMENNGSTWGLSTSFTATDISGGSSNPDGKLVIDETYVSGSVSTRTLVVKTYFGGWGLTFA